MVSPGPGARAFVARPGWPLIYQDFRSVVRQDRGELSNLAFRMQRPAAMDRGHYAPAKRWTVVHHRRKGDYAKAAAHRKAGSLFSAIPGPLRRARGTAPVGVKACLRGTREKGSEACGHSLEFCFQRRAFPLLGVHQLSFWNLELEDGVVVVVVVVAAVHKPRSPLVCLKSR